MFWLANFNFDVTLDHKNITLFYFKLAQIQPGSKFHQINQNQCYFFYDTDDVWIYSQAHTQTLHV